MNPRNLEKVIKINNKIDYLENIISKINGGFEVAIPKSIEKEVINLLEDRKEAILKELEGL